MPPTAISSHWKAFRHAPSIAVASRERLSIQRPKPDPRVVQRAPDPTHHRAVRNLLPTALLIVVGESIPLVVHQSDTRHSLRLCRGRRKLSALSKLARRRVQCVPSLNTPPPSRQATDSTPEYAQSSSPTTVAEWMKRKHRQTYHKECIAPCAIVRDCHRQCHRRQQ